jgi:hypothetical protein
MMMHARVPRFAGSDSQVFRWLGARASGILGFSEL